MCLQMMTTHVFLMVTLKTNAFKLQGKNIVKKKKEARNRHKAKRKNVIHACGGENSFYCRWDEIEMPEGLVLDVVYKHKIAEWHQFYCLHVTPLFPRQWDKLWKLQQGSL